MLRTSVAAGDLDSPATVASYEALAQVERAFRAFSTDLDIRPIRHVVARLAPILFTDGDKPAASAARPSPVAPAARSPRP